MVEIYVLVPVRKKFATVFVGVLSLVLAVICLLLSCVTMVFLPLVVVFGALWFFFMFRYYKEYEYSYFDGEVRFAKVMNKSRRKRLGVYTMDDVIQIAPAGDRSVYKYENDSNLKVKDFSSQIQGHEVYDMVLQKAGNMLLIKFEPDEKYLDAVEHKYKQKVIRGASSEKSAN